MSICVKLTSGTSPARKTDEPSRILTGDPTSSSLTRKVPPYLIFSDASLRDMAHKKPTTRDEFLDVHGVGEKKLADLGEAFLARIAAAPEEVEASNLGPRDDES